MELLRELPEDSRLVTNYAGNLTIYDSDGLYVGFIDFNLNGSVETPLEEGIYEPGTTKHQLHRNLRCPVQTQRSPETASVSALLHPACPEQGHEGSNRLCLTGSVSETDDTHNTTAQNPILLTGDAHALPTSTGRDIVQHRQGRLQRHTLPAVQ